MKKLNKKISIIVISIFLTSIAYSTPINQFINSVSPPMNSNIVVKSSDIQITFMQDMNGSLMTDENIKLFGYQTGLMTASHDYNSVTKTLTINPVNNFKNGEKISLSLTSGLKTIANESIIPFVYSFNTKSLGGTVIFTKTFGIIQNNPFTYILTGDLDNDGDLDLLINERIFKNNGNAVFTYYSSISVSGFPVLADFDNDGDLDIQEDQNNTTYFFQNNGNGDFMQTTFYSGGIGTIGDINGDGFIDMAYLPHGNNVDLFIIKNSYGLCSIDTVYQLSDDCNHTQYIYSDRIMIDDVNNDGAFDLIAVIGSGRGGVVIGYELCRNFHKMTNNGLGRFSFEQFYSTTSSSLSSFILFIKDSKSFDNNNDGFIDIQSPDVLLRNIGNGSYSYYGGIGLFSNFTEADYNGDGYIDILANDLTSFFYLYTNDGNGNFETNTINLTSRYSRSTTGDLDNDGDIDLIAQNYNTGEVEILLNGDSPLPVELNSFTSQINSNSIKLNWSTSSEQNNSGFEIQRSAVKNGTPDTWTKIGFTEGHGNSNSTAEYSFEDKNLSSGKYKYRLKQIDFNGNFEFYDLSNEVVIGTPTSTELMQNYPNPFNPVTNISYRLSENGFVTLKVFDNSGREVKTLINEFKEAGYYTNEFNGSDLASGIYFYKLTAGDFVQTKKLSLVK